LQPTILVLEAWLSIKKEQSCFAFKNKGHSHLDSGNYQVDKLKQVKVLSKLVSEKFGKRLE
jgi:hypothetical protein